MTQVCCGMYPPVQEVAWVFTDDIESVETNRDKMIINKLKYNIINFNFSEKYIVPQNLKLNGNAILVVRKIKILGVIITDDLKWEENTSLIC